MSYLRALFEFTTTEQGELPLFPGDVVLFLCDVDENWALGKLNGQEGTFPKNFVEPVVLPQTLTTAETAFVAVKDFVGEMSGDLSISRGDIVAGLKPIDANWYHGENNGAYGMFPITHVRALYKLEPGRSSTTVPVYQMDNPPVPESCANHYASPNTESANQSGNAEEIVLAKAVASMYITAQIGEELGFNKGDVVNILKVIDADFAIGECNGKRGMFPLGFVEIFEGDIDVDSLESPAEKRKSKFKWWEKESNCSNKVEAASKSTAKMPIAQAPVSQTTPLYSVAPPTGAYPSAPTPNISISSLYDNTSANYSHPDTAHNLPAVAATATGHNHESYGYSVGNTASHSSSHVPFTKSHRRTGSYTQENTRSRESFIVPYGRTLYPFIGENPNELTFVDNEIVTLIQHVDDQWIEGEIDGKRGLIPASYLEIIVDCPWYEGEQNAHVTDIEENPEFSPPCLGQVLYDYVPENKSELRFQAGEVIIILQQVDNDWYVCEKEDGLQGFCPICYVRLAPELDTIPENTDTSQEQVSVPVNKGSESKPMSATKSEDSTNVETTKQPTSPVISIDTATETVRISKAEKKDSVEPSYNKGEVISKPEPIKAKPAVKPKPSPKPALKLQPSTEASQAKPLNKQLSETEPVSETVNNNKSVIEKNRNSMITTNKLKEPSTPTTVKTSNNTAQASKTPPKRPSASPKVFLFNGQTAVKMSDNLDDIINNQLKIAKKEAESRSRTGSVASDSGVFPLPPIPDRKYTPMAPKTATLVTEKSIPPPKPAFPPVIPMRKNTPEKRIASSTFYIDTLPQRVGKSNNNNSVGMLEAPQQAPQRTAAQPSTSRVTVTSQGHQGPGHAPVPQRPAPPRPGALKPAAVDTSVAAEPGFAENDEDALLTEGLVEAECEEIVTDLDKRISEVDADLNKYVMDKDKLEKQLAAQDGSTTSNGEGPTPHEKLAFAQANITGLTEELNILKESLYQFRPDRLKADQEQERKAEENKRLIEEQRRKAEAEQKHREETIAKHRETRARVIGEILQTERDYLHSISLCHEIFTNSEKPPSVDLEALFGNMVAVIEVSQRLLTSLEGATQGREFEEQIIGKSFEELRTALTHVYAPYCRNHDDVITLIEKYEESGEIQEYIRQRLDLMRASCTVFDLAAILIKPVQRILKYPLLLNELIKNTEEDHVDKAHLLAAITAMTQVAAAINEYKRRKDLVRKYKAVKEEGIGEKFSKLNMHSTKKKFARLSQKMVGPLTVDEGFNREERRYKGLEVSIRQLVRDLAAYVDQVQDVGYCLESVAQSVADYYDDQASQRSVQQYCHCTNHIATKIVYKFKQQVELQVVHPLNRLLILYQLPSNVIKKRHDKLLDYDNLAGRGLSGAEVQAARADYEALNAQLLDELPQLCSLSTQLVAECLARLVKAQRLLISACMTELYKLPDEFLMSMCGEADAFQAAHQAAVDKMSQLLFIPKSFNPNVDERRQNPRLRRASDVHEVEWCSTQTSALRAQLRTNYSSDMVCVVAKDYTGRSEMELSLTAALGLMMCMVAKGHTGRSEMKLSFTAGTLVGVVKKRDPMGNSERWFIDNGVTKGIFPASLLEPAPPASAPTSPARQNTNSPVVAASRQHTNSPVAAARQYATASLVDIQSAQQPTNLAIKPFDHPTLFDAVCSPTFGQMLLPQPASIQTQLSSGSEAQSPMLSPAGQSASFLQPSPAQTDQSATSRQRGSSSVDDRVVSDLMQSDDMSEYFEQQWHQALYAFSARTELEVSLQEGQMVKVVEKHDLDGNSEWWLVDVSGVQGYAPANYLRAL